jgi:hypothetical protein
MPINKLLWLAAVLLAVIGVMHSYLGEKYVLGRLLALPNLPLLRHDVPFTHAVIRFAWHITSLAFWGFSAILVVMAVRPVGDARAIGAVLALTFLLCGLLIVFTAGLRHPAWPLLFISAVATFLATW